MNFYPKSIYYPRESVVEKFDKGELNLTRKRLLDFVDRHQADILLRANDMDMDTDDALIEATQQSILQIGAIHPPAEMGEQIREMHKEAWYRGEHGDLDQIRSQEEWKEKYAIQFREARIYEAFYVLEQAKDDVLELLKG